jgi:hypothetical protein
VRIFRIGPYSFSRWHPAVATIPVGDSFENSLKPGLSREKVFRLFESPNGGNGHWEKKSMGSRSTGAGKEEVYVYSWVGPPNIASGPVPPMVRIVFLDGSLLDHETFGLPKASG